MSELRAGSTLVNNVYLGSDVTYPVPAITKGSTVIYGRVIKEADPLTWDTGGTADMQYFTPNPYASPSGNGSLAVSTVTGGLLFYITDLGGRNLMRSSLCFTLPEGSTTKSASDIPHTIILETGTFVDVGSLTINCLDVNGYVVQSSSLTASTVNTVALPAAGTNIVGFAVRGTPLVSGTGDWSFILKNVHIQVGDWT